MTDEGHITFKWNNHNATFFNVMSKLRSKELYSDVTLACEGKFFPVHKFVMSTCSDYFCEVFENTPCKSPVIILKDVRQNNLEALLDYMYLGEAEVEQSELNELLRAAECLKIKGLAVPDDEETLFSTPPKNSRIPNDSSSPLPKRFKGECDDSKVDRQVGVPVSQATCNSPSGISNLTKPDLSGFPPSLHTAVSPNSSESKLSRGLLPVRRNYNPQKKIKVQTPRKTKLTQPIKVIRRPRRKKSIDALSRKMETTTSVPHNHKTFYFKHEGDGESTQKMELDSSQSTGNANGNSDTVEEQVSNHMALPGTGTSDQRLEQAGPSGLVSKKIKDEESLRVSEAFFNQIGIPKFKPILRPFLEGYELSEELEKKLTNLFIEDIIDHLSSKNIMSVLNNRKMRSHFYITLQMNILENYPNMWKVESDTNRGRKGPLGFIMSKVVNRMHSRHRREQQRTQTSLPSVPEQTPVESNPGTDAPPSEPKKPSEENGLSEEVPDRLEDAAKVPDELDAAAKPEIKSENGIETEDNDGSKSLEEAGDEEKGVH